MDKVIECNCSKKLGGEIMVKLICPFCRSDEIGVCDYEYELGITTFVCNHCKEVWEINIILDEEYEVEEWC